MDTARAREGRSGSAMAVTQERGRLNSQLTCQRQKTHNVWPHDGMVRGGFPSPPGYIELPVRTNLGKYKRHLAATIKILPRNTHNQAS